jgi:hypothetical protein
MEKEKISEMTMEYEGKSYKMELYSDRDNHYCKVKIGLDVLEYVHSQNKSFFSDFNDNMKSYFSKRSL